ncbi:MAG: toll/interleukin-1 receptor domain-containing protein [Chloroflexota bacterium]|jgi:hypothetical protein
MADIFLSYSRKNAQFRDRLVKDLQAAGFTVWTDKDLEPGTPSWTESIEQEIEVANCMIVLLSPSAKKSQWVRREVQYSQHHRKTIIPALIEGEQDSAVPIELEGYQLVDLRFQYSENLLVLKTALYKKIEQAQPPEPLRAAVSIGKPIWKFPKPRITLKATSRSELHKYIVDAFSVDKIVLVEIGKLDCSKHRNGYEAVVLFEKSHKPFSSQWATEEKGTYWTPLTKLGFKSHTRSTLFESQTKTQKYEKNTLSKEWPLSANIAEVANDIIDANLIMGLAIEEIMVSYWGKKRSD